MILGIALFFIGVLVGIFIAAMAVAGGKADAWQAGFEAGLNAPVAKGREEE